MDYIKITSSKSEFRSVYEPWSTGGPGTILQRPRGSEMYWLPDGYTTIGDPTDCAGLSFGTDAVVLKDSDGTWWLFDPTYTGAYESFDYRWAGSNGELAFGVVVSNDAFYAEDVGKIKDDYPTGSPVSYTGLNALGLIYEYCSGGYSTSENALYSFGTLLNPALACGGDTDEQVWLYVTDNSGSGVNLDDYTQTLGYTSFDNYDAKFVTMRGSQYVSPSKTQRTLKVPKSVLKATYTFATAAAATSEPDQTTLVLGEGDEATIGTSGVKIKVLNITESLTPCTFGTGAGAAPTCDMSGVSAVIMPNNAASVPAKEVFPITSNMVVLDRDATALETGTVITIGGDVVNTVTASAIAGSGVDFAAQPVVVRAIGNKIVVAGLTSEDTITAGQQFVAGVTRN